MPRARVIAVLASALVLAACAGDDAGDADPAPSTPPVSQVATPRAGVGPGSASTGDPAPPSSVASPDVTTDAGTTDVGTDIDATGDGAAPCDPVAARDADASLVVWHALSGQGAAALDGFLDEFRDRYPRIEVRVEQFQGYVNALDALRNRAAGELPHLYLGTTASTAKLFTSDLFVDPAACTGDGPSVLDDLLPVVEATYSIGGALRAVPFNVSTPVLMYDGLRVARAGLDPDDPPTTADELRVAAEQVVTSGEAATGIVFYDESVAWLVEQWAAQLGRVLIEPDNGVSGEADRVVFTHAEAVEALAWARELHRDGLAEFIGLNEAGFSDLLRMVDQQRPAAFTLHTSASLGDILLAQESGAYEPFETRAAPLPGPGRGGLVGGAAWWLRDRDDPVENGAAWLLAEFLLQPAQQAELAAATGYVPAVTTALTEPVLVERWTEVPAFEVGYRQLEAMGTSPAEVGMQVVPRAEIQRTLQLAAERVVREDADPLTELRAAEAQAEEQLSIFAAAGG